MLTKAFLCAYLIVQVASQTITDAPNRCPEAGSYQNVLYADVEDCGYFFQCDNGVPVRQMCPPGETWSDIFQTCVGYNTQYDTCTRENAERECDRQEGAALLIGHPTICQRFYNCSKTSPPSMFSFLQKYEDECPYSQVFDIVQRKCQSFQQAYCGPYRVADKDPCDYVKNRCGSSHCEPCSSRLPSCVGRADGLHEHPTKQKPFYIVCQLDRLVRVLVCRTLISQDCQTVWEAA